MRRSGVRSLAALAALAINPESGGGQEGRTAEGTLPPRMLRAGEMVAYLTGPAASPLAPDTAVIDQRGFQFVPRLVTITPGSVVIFVNSDPFLHNVFSPRGASGAFDLGTYPRTESRAHTFQSAGVHVILCHVHPEMVATVLVLPTRHHVVVSEDGRFRFTGVAPGSYTLHVWRRRGAPYERPLTIAAGDTVPLRMEVKPW